MYYELMETVSNLANRRILVIGDVMLDKYLISDVDRISQEAPVPIANVKTKENFLGGAGNVAASIKTLGSHAGIIGEIGDDDNGMEVIELLKGNGINPSLTVTSNIITTTKNRILSRSNQQLIRFDEEMITTPKEGFINSYIKALINSIDAIIISDYGKGFINDDVLFNVSKQKGNIPIFIDPSSKTEYHTYITNSYVLPNEKEEEETDTSFFENKIITMGCKGIRVIPSCDNYQPHNRSYIVPPLETYNVWNTTGAGDTVTAVFALGIISGLDMYQSASLANIAAGITVRSPKTYQVTNQELKDEIYRLKNKLNLL